MGSGSATNNRYIMAGLSYTNPDHTIATQQYCWYTYLTGFTIMESGSLASGTTLGGFGALNTTAVLKIARENGMINYYKDNVLQRSVTDPQPETAMIVDFSLFENARSIYSLKIGSVSYDAVAVMKADYYPFGMTMPGRSSNANTYRYAYNGMEQDQELKGTGNSYTTEFRQYDPRLGRWLSLDPLKSYYPSISPYCAFNNNPIYYVDPFGLEGEPRTKNWEKGETCVDENNNILQYLGNDEWGEGKEARFTDFGFYGAATTGRDGIEYGDVVMTGSSYGKTINARFSVTNAHKTGDGRSDYISWGFATSAVADINLENGEVSGTIISGIPIIGNWLGSVFSWKGKIRSWWLPIGGGNAVRSEIAQGAIDHQGEYSFMHNELNRQYYSFPLTTIVRLGLGPVKSSAVTPAVIDAYVQDPTLAGILKKNLDHISPEIGYSRTVLKHLPFTIVDGGLVFNLVVEEIFYIQLDGIIVDKEMLSQFQNIPDISISASGFIAIRIVRTESHKGYQFVPAR